MKTFSAASLLFATMIGFTVGSSARAEGQFYFPVGFSYASGIQDATDTLVDAYERAGYDIDRRIEIPIGLTLDPYYEWRTSIGAIGVGITVGPTAFVLVDEKTSGYWGSSSDTYRFSFAVPVGGFVRYTPWPKATVAPYVRAGVKYPFAGGDNFESSQVGAFGGVGIDFWRTKSIGMSIEVGYDMSEIAVKFAGFASSEKVTFSAFTVGLSVVF